jgi:hypothetical protein
MIDLASLAVLKGKKALVTGIANDQSIAWGCAKAFHAFGADLAITYHGEKTKRYVDPLAKQVEASIYMPLDVQKPGDLEAVLPPSKRSGASWTSCCTQSPLPRRTTCKAASSTARRTDSCWRWSCRAGRSSAWPSWPSRS